MLPARVAALIVNVGAETSDAGAGETQVGRFGALEILMLRGRQQRQQQAARIVGGERGATVHGQVAVHAQAHWGAGDQQNVGSPAPQGEL